MDYPRSPWQLRGDLLLSVWWADGILVGTAFVDYRPGGDLSYHELLAARAVRGHGVLPATRITDIWVDSAPSRDGGRELWAIPKELADFTGGSDAWTAATGGGPIASARFRRRRRLPGRWPVRLLLSQPREPGTPGSAPRSAGSAVRSWVRGSAVVHTAAADWTVDPDRALGRLSDRRPFLSLVLADFHIAVG